jgi:hypothetical protein
MIFSNVLLPDPFKPRTPIFAPGRNGQPDIFQHLGIGG